ncbi:hypothetical protein QUF70_17765 [Desulfobacterales bacterium HSG17]|nr:hypothetical protein [Desulfobacterales bacterium HSG17]
MDKLGELKNQLYNFMRNLSKEKPSKEKLDRMLKLMGQMEDVLYEINQPTTSESRIATRKMILRLRVETESEKKMI